MNRSIERGRDVMGAGAVSEGTTSRLAMAHRLCRALCLACACWLPIEPVSGAHGQTRLDEGTGLDGCLSSVIAEFRAHGAGAARRHPPVFALAPQSFDTEVSLPQAGCLGVLAVGRRQVQQLAINIYDTEGDSLASAGGSGAYSYTRACGPAGRRMVIQVAVRAGAGEVDVVTLFGAPEQLPALEALMQRCIAVGQPAAEAVDVGPEPIGAPLGQRWQLAARKLEAAGYVSIGEPLFGSLGRFRREQRYLELPSDRCVAVTTVTDGDMDDLDVRLYRVDNEPVLIGRAASRAASSLIRICTEGNAKYVLDLRSFGRGGRYVVSTMTISPPAGLVAPVGLHGAMRGALWEVAHRFQGVGLQISEVQWADLAGASEYRAPLPLQSNRCYGVAVIAGQEARLDAAGLSLTDRQGTLVASDTGPGTQKWVYHCPRVSGGYAAHVLAPAGIEHTRALLVLAVGSPLD